jgi:hypothetical protein
MYPMYQTCAKVRILIHKDLNERVVILLELRMDLFFLKRVT